MTSAKLSKAKSPRPIHRAPLLLRSDMSASLYVNNFSQYCWPITRPRLQAGGYCNLLTLRGGVPITGRIFRETFGHSPLEQRPSLLDLPVQIEVSVRHMPEHDR